MPLKQYAMFAYLFIFSVSSLASDVEITPIQNFEVEKYEGLWFEIARYENRFEKGLENVTAQYQALENGRISVINRGFSSDDNEWTQANGKAYFPKERNVGYLKVTFFWPFYGKYVVLHVDEAYQYAIVSGGEDLLWLLARQPVIEEKRLNHLLTKIQQFGFDTDKLKWVIHDKKNPALIKQGFAW